MCLRKFQVMKSHKLLHIELQSVNIIEWNSIINVKQD